MAKLPPKRKIIVIVGPTASGKSSLSIELAKKLDGEIISADSRQVYRGMDIGTGKVTKKEQKMAQHHLIDVANPKRQFTADNFKKLGEKALSDIASRTKLPIIVGGTGFYIDILLGRMAVSEVPPNKKLRAILEKQSPDKLFQRLSKLDPEYAKRIDRHNQRRLIRALEIVITTKKPITPAVIEDKYKILWLGISPSKETLAKKIEARLDDRLNGGMVKEVEKLLAGGVSHKKLQSFGLEYKWISLYLQHKASYQEMRDNLLRDIIRYSKRQITWFKRNKKINWVENKKQAFKLASRFIAPLPPSRLQKPLDLE